MEAVVAGREIDKGELAAALRVRPGLDVAVHAVAEADAFGRHQAVRCIGDLQLPAAEARRGVGLRYAVHHQLLDDDGRRNRILADDVRIENAHTVALAHPDPAVAVGGDSRVRHAASLGGTESIPLVVPDEPGGTRRAVGGLVERGESDADDRAIGREPEVPATIGSQPVYLARGEALHGSPRRDLAAANAVQHAPAATQTPAEESSSMARGATPFNPLTGGETRASGPASVITP